MVAVSYLAPYDTLLQNATDIITKCDSYFITKRGKSSLQKASGFLLQNVTILLQDTTFTTKYDVHYKIRRYKNFLSKQVKRNPSLHGYITRLLVLTSTIYWNWVGYYEQL